jgi:hypothetical protein
MKATSADTFIGTMNGRDHAGGDHLGALGQRVHQRRGEKIVDRAGARPGERKDHEQHQHHAHGAHQPLAQLDQVGDEGVLLHG